MPPLLLTSFGALDWGIVIGYLVVTTILGERLAGKQATIREFFLGGKKLPWYAVAGSIISTEISAVTFLSVPYVVFKDGGDCTYLQFGLIGSFLARLIVGYVLVPAYYQREIYSPYDYLGHRLGESVKRITSALFAVGGIFSQAARLYLTAVVLELVLPANVLAAAEAWTGLDPLAFSIVAMGAVAIVWTLLGGMSTVIWTDVISFGVFLLGAGAALIAIVNRLDGGFQELVSVGMEAGKFRLIDASLDPAKTYTIWIAAFAVTIGNVGAYGMDQLMAQRMFCCRNEREARKAVVWSSVAVGITILVSLVGIGLYAFYRANPLSGESLSLFQAKGDRIFPIFILNEIPSGLSGLVIAGVFAAAIAGLDSIFVALAQTVMSTIVLPRRARELERRGARDGLAAAQAEGRSVTISKLLVVAAGIVMSLVAIGMDEIAKHYDSILDLALGLATYYQGGLLAAFLLAFLPFSKDGHGLKWSVPLSVLAVFALNWQPRVHSIANEFAIGTLTIPLAWPTAVCLAAGAILVGSYCATISRRGEDVPARRLARAALLAGACGAVVALNLHASFERTDATTGATIYRALAFPWHAPIGCAFALLVGHALGNPRRSVA